MKIVCLGDSLTFGYKMKRKDTWPEILGRKIGVDVVNKGINGDTTTGFLSRFEKDVIDENPSHVVIMGGVNDLFWEVPLSVIKSNIAALVFQAYHYRIKPLLGIPIPIIPREATKYYNCNIFKNVNKQLKQYREWLLNFTSFARYTKCICLDIYDIFYDPMKDEGRKKLYIDGLHPTIEGNEKIAQYIISKI